MLNTQTLRGHWNELQGKLRQKWGQLTHDDVKSFDGNVEQLIGMIQRKTGEARNAIETFLESASAEGGSVVSQAAEAVGKYASDTADAVRKTTQQAVDTVRHGYEEAQSTVQQRPTMSAAVCFGAGLVFGLCLSLMMRNR